MLAADTYQQQVDLLLSPYNILLINSWSSPPAPPSRMPPPPWTSSMTRAAAASSTGARAPPASAPLGLVWFPRRGFRDRRLRVRVGSCTGASSAGSWSSTSCSGPGSRTTSTPWTRPTSARSSNLLALRSPAGGLAAAYSGQGWTVFQLPSTSGQLRAVESATEGQDTPDMDSS